jgi:nucleotide-binding universal stress UspA family protein
MSNITVLYAGTPRDTAAVQFAATLANGLGGVATCRLVADERTVLGAEQWRDYQMVVGLEGFSVAHPLRDEHYATQLQECVEAAQIAFKEHSTLRGIVWGDYLDLRQSSDAELVALGYLNDLVIAGFDSDPVIVELLSKTILLGSSGPVVLINSPPQAITLANMNVVIAWKPAIATSHAIQSALPILRAARNVHVISIEEPGEPAMIPSSRDLADYLRASHHVTATASLVRAADNPCLQLAELYREYEADLLVMGGYSRSWATELLFGGFTRHFVTQRTCNLLLAH